jgi:hypothetical protein
MHINRSSTSLFRNRRLRLGYMILLSLSLVRCECDEVEEFIPAANYEPSPILDFGKVPVTTQKTLDIQVRSDGRAPLRIESLTTVPSNAETAKIFKITTDAELVEGLTPGQTSTITVRYRPCPAAWTADVINDDYDFNKCAETAHQVNLAIIDNSRLGSAEIVITGQPVQAPVLKVFCPRGGNNCGVADPQLSECINFSFGNVKSGDTPCDIEFEIRNYKREDSNGNGKLTGDLIIERAEMLAFEVTGSDPTVRNGKDLGFVIVDAAGQEVNFGASPLVVRIPDTAQDFGAVKLRARFSGAERGTWRGEERKNSGMRLYSNDPDHRPVKTISFSGTGSAPDIQIWPPIIQFGPVPQGSTKTATLTVSNAGDAPLTINSVNFETDTSGMKFVYTTSLGMPPFTVPSFTSNRFDLFVSYTPVTGGQDADVLVIECDDINDSPVHVPVTGGAVPRIKVEPADTLVFALPNPLPPPPIPPRTETFRVSNIGYGELTISQFALVGPGADPMHPSVDDFTIAECMGQNPCDPNLVLCSPTQMGCTNSEATFSVVYSNNDNSTTDLAELRIASNDPADTNHILVLSAQDVPCLFPTPVITLTSTAIEVGAEIRVNALTSDAGGAPGGMGMLSDYQWSWLFTPGAQPSFTSQGTVSTSFTPTTPGAHILGLHVVNDCGSMSQTAANETISVSP